MRTVLFFLILMTLLSGCRTTGDVKEVTNEPPVWLTGEPRVEGMICAVGMSEPTYFKKDAWKYAAENARKALAHTLSIEINTLTVDMSSEKGSSINEGSVIQVSSWATDAVVKDSEVLEYWNDAEGMLSRKNITYALACMPRNANMLGSK